MKKYKVLITTSGLGQRLGELTQYTNTVLIRIGKKPVMSHIIESYDKNTEFVITVGHFSKQIKDFIKITYPKIKVTFVEVDNYQGEGSSLGYSMLQAKKYLQCPFIFNASDTIVTDKIPLPIRNWNGGYKGENSAMYSSFTVSKNEVQLINDKGASELDYIHIGLVGIKDYKSFWYFLESIYNADSTDFSLNDCKVINLMIGSGKRFEVEEFPSWQDIGNIDGLNKARKDLANEFKNLDRPGESVYLFDDFVVKFYRDESMVLEGIKRAKILKSLIPLVEDQKGNFFRYKYIRGQLYSKSILGSDFKKFLIWCKKKLWLKKEEVNREKFKKICREFYQKNTLEHIEQFLSVNRLQDRSEIINGEKVPKIKDLLKNLDFKYFSDADQYRIHGDLVLENVIKTEKGYKLLDWDQSFGGLLRSGDIYYDLSKLNHSLIVTHDIVDKNLFTFSKEGDEINCDILRSDNLVSCQNLLFDFIQEENFDKYKVLALTAIIWLNMAPLHPVPLNFNFFLYYFGKLCLYRELKHQD